MPMRTWADHDENTSGFVEIDLVGRGRQLARGVLLTAAFGVVWEPEVLQAALAIAGGFPTSCRRSVNVWDAADSSTSTSTT